MVRVIARLEDLDMGRTIHGLEDMVLIHFVDIVAVMVEMPAFLPHVRLVKLGRSDFAVSA